MKSKIKTGSAIALVGALAMLAACSDSESKNISGGVTEDKGIVADLDVAGVSQKGPFVEGSAVTVQGIDCKTLKFTDEVFEGKVKSDKGDFTVESVTLKSTCALFEVTGEYRSEITGKKSAGEITLHALTDLKDRKNVNINVLTELEYERLMYLVTEKGKKFADAKERAEKEVLAAFDIKGDFVEFENLNIFESGDENAALLAVSVMMQAETDDAGLAKRVEKFADSFAETGEWKDSDTKKVIADWAIEATANGGLDSIRKNVEAWNDGDKVAAFEKFIEAYADGDSIVLSSDSESSSSVTPKSSDSETSVSSSSVPGEHVDPSTVEKGTMTDDRDGKTYKTVKIGDQVWMAENLNFETDSSFCYNDSAEYCAKYGRLYRWTAAMDACPSGWHLPDLAEWKTLLAAVGGDSIAGTKLKSTSGWNSDGNGTDDFGFTVLPAGGWRSKDFVGEVAAFWTSSWYEEYGDYVNGIKLYTDNTIVRQTYRSMYYAYSVRCVKGSATVPPSSSSSKPVETSSSSSKPVETSSSSGNSSSSQFKRVPCNVDTDENCFKDERDGQTYRMVKIGDQVWMAENLNLETESSSCYNNSAENCEKYGRLYTWAAAMDSAGTWSANGKGCGYKKTCSPTYPVRGVCPEGWHLPTQAEWKALFTAVGDSSTVGKMLKSISGWNDSGNGTDSYAFSALPAGYWDGYYNYEGSAAFFWSPTEYDSYYAYYMYLGYYFDHAGLDDHRKADGLSVRCVRD